MKNNGWRIKLSIALVPVIFIIVFYGGFGDVAKNHFYDDAYITYRFAANYSLNNGLVFNVGEQVNSASALTYTLLLSLFYDLGVTNLEFVSIVTSLLSVSGISLLLHHAIKKQTKNNLLAIFLSVLTGIHGLVSGWAMSGMETIFFTFLVFGFIYQYLYQKNKSSLLFAFTMILILLIRTEGIIILGVWGLFEFFDIVYNDIQNKKRMFTFVVNSLIFTLTLIIFYYFQFKYYGSFMTNAFYFKKIAVYYQPNPFYIMQVLGGTSLFVSLLAIYSIFVKKSKNIYFLYTYLILSIISLLIGPFSDGARYSAHLIPLVFLLASISIQNLITKKNHKIVMIFGLLITLQTFFSFFLVRHYALVARRGQQCRRELGNYLNENLNNNDFVLSGDIGMIAYEALEINFIDLGGLTSKDVLERYENKLTLDEVVLQKKPKMLADTFYKDKNDKLVHPILMNDTEFIKGMTTYTNLPFEETFESILYECSDDKRTYAVVNLKSLYNNVK